MAITAQDVKKLRDLTNAGMMDCKKALTEANGDFDKARDILRERGQLVAAKRADRVASEGAAIAAISEDGKRGAAIILNCETDFVGTNDKFLALANSILKVALNEQPADLAALKALKIDGQHTIDEEVNNLTGVIGEKIDLSAYQQISAEKVALYVHNKKIAALVGFNQDIDAENGKKVAMQIATMNPVAVDKDSVPQSVIDEEIKVAIEKTKQEQVQKAVDAALKKAGINPAHVDSPDHIESNVSKGWISAEQAEQAKQIIASVSAEKSANLPEAMIQNITKGRIAKFFKENTLVEQEFFAGDGDESKLSVGQFLAKINKDLKPVAMVRLALGQ